VQLPEIRAAIELQRDQPAKAVELLASASPYERAYPEAVYLRGLAYLSLRDGVKAAAEFRKILDHRGARPGGKSNNTVPQFGLQPCRTPTGAPWIQDLPELGCGLHAIAQTQVRQTTQVHRSG